MDGLETAEFADDIGYIVFLEKADRSDAGGSSLEAGGSVVEGDATKGQDWNFVLAGLPKDFQSGGF